ncbi:MAG: RNA-binding S4 domain-containing protein [Cyanobium sp.]
MTIKLDQYLKWHGLAATGGEAKLRIQRGDVRVNGRVETRRGRQLALGDAVEIDGLERIVQPPEDRSGGGRTRF